MVRGMKHARSLVSTVVEFERCGRRYSWIEGAAHPAAARFRGRRNELGALFARSVAPSLDRRGLAREVVPADPQARSWWVRWRAEDGVAVWGLYVSTRGLPAEATRDLGAPANDGALLAAWGDGPVLAWASERPALRDALCDALRALPAFLAEGVCSADESFAVRVVGR